MPERQKTQGTSLRRRMCRDELAAFPNRELADGYAANEAETTLLRRRLAAVVLCNSSAGLRSVLQEGASEYFKPSVTLGNQTAQVIVAINSVLYQRNIIDRHKAQANQEPNIRPPGRRLQPNLRRLLNRGRHTNNVGYQGSNRQRTKYPGTTDQNKHNPTDKMVGRQVTASTRNVVSSTNIPKPPDMYEHTLPNQNQQQTLPQLSVSDRRIHGGYRSGNLNRGAETLQRQRQ
ncbi:hypothetical protein EG328_002855 [Venturia inaequalis]|uniref:Uncharacterized protein n=1 Tax=Venturia inaequalis TaxID=5025 RepID=A0A8H3Z0Z2_VENIN|nr:hypothetical protein EG328_002855 [Venturia inaequalis]